MDLQANFFVRNIILVYFFYGLSFFMMGLAVYIEVGRRLRAGLRQSLAPIGRFWLDARQPRVVRDVPADLPGFR